MVQENHATVKLVSSGMKTYSETRIYIELRNLRKMLDNSSQFLSSEQPSELKNLDVAINIAGVVKIRSENLRLWRPFDSSFEWQGALVTVKSCVLCGR